MPRLKCVPCELNEAPDDRLLTASIGNLSSDERPGSTEGKVADSLYGNFFILKAGS